MLECAVLVVLLIHLSWVRDMIRMEGCSIVFTVEVGHF